MPGIIPEHMKPSKCGAIVIFSWWEGKKVINATPTGEKIPSGTLKWLMAFAREHSLPLVFNEYLFRDGKYAGLKRKGYGPPSFIREVDTRIKPEDIMKS